MTYVALGTVRLTSSASTITFSSIPTTGFRDLVLVGAGITAGGALDVALRFNGDSGSNYSEVNMSDFGGPSSSSSTQDKFGIGRFDEVQGNFVGTIMDYSATDKHKSMLTRYNNPQVVTVARAGRWANTSAINTILVYNGSGNGHLFGAGVTISLYGIRA